MPYRTVIHINEAAPEKHAAVLRNALNLITALGPETAVELVTHGPGIALAAGTASPELKTLIDRGVVVCVCQNSLAAQNLTADDVLPEARIVASGVAHLVTRQAEGWAYLRP
ncbi:DsrE family protein [Specibacter cremeus]|uniref:DsrE family protein n=1 Tax=Specibacter cremeus TaxID=1629051 RepID=UPI0013DE6939|nr:DsrE family protein [Specibacter cremeus]